MKNTRNLLMIALVVAISLQHAITFRAYSIQDEPNERRSECGQVLARDEDGSFSRAGRGRFNRTGLGSGRILYGNDAYLGEWPWIVQLVTVIQGELPNNCSGSLINSRWVLTAGHCAERVSEPKYWKATMGLYNIDEPNYIATDRLIDKIVLHPNYRNLNNDVALFHLSQPIQFSKYIRPVCLIGTNENVVSYTQGKNCFATGYGHTIGTRPASKLQKLKVVAHSSAYCLANWARKKSRVREGAVCVGPNNSDMIGATCRGDSGGPNVCFNEQADRWEQFGVVSYGPTQCDRGQGDKWLTAVADLTHYGDWIRANTDI